MLNILVPCEGAGTELSLFASISIIEEAKSANASLYKELFVLSLIMAGLVVNAQADKTDFSGTWNLNAEKSI